MNISQFCNIKAELLRYMWWPANFFAAIALFLVSGQARRHVEVNLSVISYNSSIDTLPNYAMSISWVSGLTKVIVFKIDRSNNMRLRLHLEKCRPMNCQINNFFILRANNIYYSLRRAEHSLLIIRVVEYCKIYLTWNGTGTRVSNVKRWSKKS